MQRLVSLCLTIAGTLALALTLDACGEAQEVEPEPEVAVVESPFEPVREIINIAGDLYRARNNNHFTVFLVTPEGVVLGDPINVEFATWLQGELARRFDGATVSHVVYSHSHWDHAAGGAVFADTATFVAHEAMPNALMELPSNATPFDVDANDQLERAEATGGYLANFDALDRNGDGVLTGAEITADVHPPDTLYAEMMTLEVGGKTIELIHPGPAHADDMTVLYFPEERAAFAVDYINVRRLPGTITGTTFEEYAAAIEAILALNLDTVVPGHGDIGMPEDLAEYGAFLEDLRAAVLVGINQGMTAEEIQASVQLEQYADWLLFEDRRTSLVEQAYAILTTQQ